MSVLGDRVVSLCQVAMPAGRTVCARCRQTVQAERTGVKAFDVVRRVHPWLVRTFGTVGANVVAAVLVVVLFWLVWFVHVDPAFCFRTCPIMRLWSAGTIPATGRPADPGPACPAPWDADSPRRPGRRIPEG